MEEKKLRSIGIDLSSGFASVSYLENRNPFPRSLSMNGEDGRYVIPMVLYKKEYMEEWLIGDEAVFAAEYGNTGNRVDRILDMYQKEEVVYIENRTYTGKTLLEIYLKSLYEKTKALIGEGQPEVLVFTVEQPGAEILGFLKNLFETYGFEKHQIRLRSHTECFAFYTLANKKELWANDVTLFFMDEKRFFCQNMTKKKEKNKIMIFVEEEDLSGMVCYDMLRTEEGRQKADEALCHYLEEDYKTHIVSSVFFSGIGFYENWYQKVVREICKKRKAFKGFNLYADGAAASVEIEENPELQIYCEGRTSLWICVDTGEDGKNMYTFSKPGESWTDSKGQAEFLVDNTEEIHLVLISPFQHGSQELLIPLTGFPKRRDKTLCVKITLAYENEKEFEIVVEDMGFGPFFPSSGKKIIKRISL